MTDKSFRDLWVSMEAFWKEYVESDAHMQLELTELLMEKSLKETFEGVHWAKVQSINTIVNSYFQNLIMFMEAKKCR